MSSNAFSAILTGFQGTNALFSLPNLNYNFSLPIQTLPSHTLEPGTTLQIKLLTPEEQKTEYENLARAILQEMVN